MKKENKTERVVTEDNYREKVLKTMIILCWVILGVCFAVKLFGGNFFEIVCNNRRFIKICKYIDNHEWLAFLTQGMVYMIATTLYIIASCKNKIKNKSLVIIIIVLIAEFSIKRYILINSFQYLAIFLELLVLIIIPLIYKTKILSSIIFYVLVNLFSIISMIVKNLGYGILAEEYSLIALIFLIDYYIMITLFFLYSIQLKRRNKMGVWGIGWLHKEVTKYETLKAKNLKRIEELQNENNEIDKKIAELKKEEGK